MRASWGWRRLNGPTPSRALGPLAAGDLRGGDHGLRPALGRPSFCRICRNMRLDGRFPTRRLIGICLLSSPSDSIIKHPHLLRRQRHQPVAQAPMSGSSAEVRSVSGGTQTSPSITFMMASRSVSTPKRLGMKPEAPKSSERRIVQHRRWRTQMTTEWPDTARADRSAGEPRDPRHGEIEQDQIDVGIPFQQGVRSSNDPASLTTATPRTLTTA